jgi:hypothetical protein
MLKRFSLSRAVPLGLAAVCLTSCFSPKFNAEWRKADNSGAGTQRWAGRWESDRGTGGRLRALVEKPDRGGMNVYFEAGWHGFTTAYPVALRTEAKDGGFKVSGEHRLKSFVGGGMYTYDGSLSREKFSVRYSSSYDSGTFALSPVATP